MFHEINAPHCIDQLEKIVLFQRQVIAFACKYDTPLPITKDKVILEFDNEIGEWFWRKLWINRKNGDIDKTQLHKELEKVIRYVQRYPTMNSRIIDAFDHDMKFNQHLNDPDFKFKYGQLSKTLQQNVKGLLIAFYTELLSSGFPPAIHGKDKKFDRDKFIESFWKTNFKLEVCPACDRPRSDTVDNKVYSDADHFFPKSIYPFLSVHHANLVPLCLDCNRSFKGARNPIDDPNNEPLVNTFHPYINPAINHVDVQVSRDQAGQRQVKIEDKAGMPSRRVASLNEVFKLEKRWLGNLNFVVKSIVDDILKTGRRDKRWQIQPSLQDFKVDLEDMLEDRIKKLGQRYDYVLQSSYLKYALTNCQELDELFAQYNQS